MIQGIVVFLITLLIGFRPASFAILPLGLLFMFLIAMLFASVGTAVATQLEDMQAFPLIINFLIMPIFFISGALFPLEGVPALIGDIAKINPLSYGVDSLRGILTGVSHFGLFFDFNILVFATLVLFILGVYLFSRIEV